MEGRVWLLFIVFLDTFRTLKPGVVPSWHRKMFSLVAMAQLKPSCSHSSSIQIVFNNLNERDFLIFLSGSITTIVPAGKPPQMACTSTVASHKKCINNSPDSWETGRGKRSNL